MRSLRALRYRLQFSLASALAATFVLCLLLGSEAARARRQRDAHSVINRLHGIVAFSGQREPEAAQGSEASEAPGVGAAARRLIGEEHFQSIVEVDISFNPFVIGADPKMRASDENLRVVCATGSLRRLNLNGTAVTDAGLACIARSQDLESLELCNAITSTNLARFMLLRRLGKGFGDWTGVFITEGEYGALGRRRETSGTLVCCMPSFPRSASVPVESMARFAGPLITDGGLRHIGRLRSLRDLRLDGTRVTDSGSKWLVGLRELERLSLRETAVGDETLAIVCRLPKLRSLDLSDTKVTNAGLINLRELGPGASVRLSDTAVTQDAVGHVVADWPPAKWPAPKVDLTSDVQRASRAPSGL